MATKKGPPAKAKDPLPDGDIDLKMFDPVRLAFNLYYVNRNIFHFIIDDLE